jgi:hypothetical protein
LSRRNHFHRTACWLALLAVAMLFIAPVISKSLMHHSACEHSSMMMTMDMSDMDHHMPMPEPCPQASMPHNMLMSGPGMSPGEEIACGYCQLLIHLPFIQFCLTVLLLLLLTGVRRTPVLALCCATLSRPWSPHPARAPPSAAFCNA